MKSTAQCIWAAIVLFFLSCVNSIYNNTSLNPIVVSGNHNTAYTVSVNITCEYIYVFSCAGVSSIQPARVNVERFSLNIFPIFVVVKQQKGVLSWELPLHIDSQTSLSTSRTVCPDENYLFKDNSQLFVSLSTASPENVNVSLLVTQETYFVVKLYEERTITVSPAEPRYFAFKFGSKSADTVLLQVHSNDDLCTTVSIQNISCPVFDLEHNVEFEGYWQTVTKQGGITLTKKLFPNGFYIVFVVKADDYDCSGSYTSLTPAINTSAPSRNKSLTFFVRPSITPEEYFVAAVSAVAVLGVFCMLYLIFSVIYFVRNVHANPEERVLDDTSWADTGEGSIQECPGHSLAPSFNHSDSSLDETDIDMLMDADSEKEIFRTKTVLTVADLARKHPRVLHKKSQLYLWNLLTVAVFYSLPVVQLVITYQKVLNQTGNQDLCYYNFLCSHPLGLLSDFNHVFSNIGYFCLGLLFIALTYRHKTISRTQNKVHGIPQHYGLLYAMGAALMMEGVLSGCYHVCPNHSNFQFDTSFMYVIAMMCMVKIYQTRHPDINANAYATFGVLAIVIFIGMCGVLTGTPYFWIVFTIVHLIVCLLLSVQIYYMGRWNLDVGIFKRTLSVIKHDFLANPRDCIRPVYPNRMVLLSLGNIFNWLLAGFGLLYHLRDFATYLLAIFMVNLVLYTTFYIVMKLCHKEKILIQPLIYIIMALLSWSAALYFFFNKSISWALTPAESRAYNQPCELLDFYDKHDIWHFLSAASMFFSFMVLLTLDDDLTTVERTKIPVF
ncbi:SID1 transmembrane family member 1-like [Bacillus rossius redtenbacheri]|uniref:SID1 transmembrane family member 1-like n=1 Tax=Bacillus rossius redtenbacheri TaxID=93214 RepID=UPI002FDE2A63